MKCKIEDCDNEAVARELCHMHYKRDQRRRQDEAAPPLEAPKREPKDLDATMLLRLTSDMRSAVVRASETDGISPSEWVRRAVERALRKRKG